MEAVCLWPGSVWQCWGVGLRFGYCHIAAHILPHKRLEMQLPIPPDAQHPCAAAQLRRGGDSLWLAHGMRVITRGGTSPARSRLAVQNARQYTTLRNQRLPPTVILILGANVHEKGQVGRKVLSMQPVGPGSFFCIPLGDRCLQVGRERRRMVVECNCAESNSCTSMPLCGSPDPAQALAFSD